MTGTVEINQRSVGQSLRLSPLFVITVVHEACINIQKRKARISVAFVKPSEIKRLNMIYRGKNIATDVLSYPLPITKISNHENVWGEIVVCPSVAKKEARVHHCSYKEEIARLIIHGILHIAGYRHDTSNNERIMFGLTDHILKRALQ